MEKEYIDTAIFPLLPIAFGEQMKRAAEQGEFISLLVLHLEKQFKGRMFVFPPITYLDDASGEIINIWGENAKKAGFKHVFYVTSDNNWKIVNNISKGTIIHVPSIPLEHLDESYKHEMMAEQTKKIMSKIIDEWQNNQ